MIINIRQGKSNGEKALGIIIIPETQQERRDFQLTRWRFKNQFPKILEFIAGVITPDTLIEWGE